MTDQATNIATNAFIIRTPSRVYCPGCGYAISQRTFHLAYGIMWCLRCGEQSIHPHDWLAFALRWDRLGSDWLRIRGIRLWVPDEPGDGLTSKYIRIRRMPHYTPEQIEHYLDMEEEHVRKSRGKRAENEPY